MLVICPECGANAEIENKGLGNIVIPNEAELLVGCLVARDAHEDRRSLSGGILNDCRYLLEAWRKAESEYKPRL